MMDVTGFQRHRRELAAKEKAEAEAKEKAAKAKKKGGGKGDAAGKDEAKIGDTTA